MAEPHIERTGGAAYHERLAQLEDAAAAMCADKLSRTRDPRDRATLEHRAARSIANARFHREAAERLKAQAAA